MSAAILRDPLGPPDDEMPEGLLAYVGHVVRQETWTVAPRLALAQALGGLLPIGSGPRVRRLLLRAAGLALGRGTVVLGRLRFTGSRRPAARLRVGRNVTLNYGCTLDLGADVTIGDDVGVGQEVMLLTSRHSIGPSGRRVGPLEALPVVIGDGAWLSTRAIVLPGVTIGPGAVVAAGAVVTTDVPADTLVGGVPARPIRQLPP